jgi:hypothetical protein
LHAFVPLPARTLPTESRDQFAQDNVPICSSNLTEADLLLCRQHRSAACKSSNGKEFAEIDAEISHFAGTLALDPIPHELARNCRVQPATKVASASLSDSGLTSYFLAQKSERNLQQFR